MNKISVLKYFKTLFRTTSIITISIILSIGILVAFAVNWPTATPDGEVTGGKFMNYFTKMLVNTNPATTDGTVKKAVTLINQDCGTGKTLQGFDSSGNRICSNGDHQSGQYYGYCVQTESPATEEYPYNKYYCGGNTVFPAFCFQIDQSNFSYCKCQAGYTSVKFLSDVNTTPTTLAYGLISTSKSFIVLCRKN